MDKVKETASQVTEKSKDLTEKGKDKVEDSKARKRIKELEREIGGIVYVQRSGVAGAAGTDDDGNDAIDALVAEITELRNSIDDDSEGDGEDEAADDDS
ncbi:MAG: hypothetical protein M5U31_15195 [Acidimicrobiia bacterium]|nr:hypothetical protein [Acidimicrobiia bacterium]